MTFKDRLTWVSAAAVALTIVVASVFIFVVVRGQLRTEVDEALEERAFEIRRGLAGEKILIEDGTIVRVQPPAPLDPASYAHVVDDEGVAFAPGRSEPAFQPGQGATEVARGERSAYFEDLTIQGTHVRVYTTAAVPGYALQVARSLEEVYSTLSKLGLILFIMSATVIAAAAALGRVVATAALGPVRRLTEATEHVTTTTDLSGRIEASGTDELSRLAASFNRMLEALERSLKQQRQLVADASHELRTPLTSIRTNIELLAFSDDMDEADRRRLNQDIVAQIEELTMLVTDLVELARGNEPDFVVVDLRLDELVDGCVAKARRRHPTLSFETSFEDCVVTGTPERLDRAVGNLLDNAAKWSPSEGVVEVSVAGGIVCVRDHGPGIDDEDLPHVFDRFYRARSARGLPGSGLGLAIVKQVIESHRGTVAVANEADGGARFCLEL
jgi:two-component system sensor histidine kinase MprB